MHGLFTDTQWWLCVKDVTRKVLLKSLHNDPHTTWVKGPSGKHTNVSALLDWPDDDDDEDSNDNSDSEQVSSPLVTTTASEPFASTLTTTSELFTSPLTTTSDSLHNVSSQSRADSVDGDSPSLTSHDNTTTAACVGKYAISKISITEFFNKIWSKLYSILSWSIYLIVFCYFKIEINNLLQLDCWVSICYCHIVISCLI